MYHRECQRRSNGLARMVPRLREIHVLRDAWTKLNVHPAKIMQVCFSQPTHACILHVCTSAWTWWPLLDCWSSCDIWWSFIRMLLFFDAWWSFIRSVLSYSKSRWWLNYTVTSLKTLHLLMVHLFDVLWSTWLAATCLSENCWVMTGSMPRMSRLLKMSNKVITSPTG